MTHRRHEEVAEAARFEAKAQRDFDKWFYSLPKQERDELRKRNVLPYREQLVPMHVIQYDPNRPNSTGTLFDFTNDHAHEDTFYSREKVEEFTRRLLETLEYSHSPDVRLHFQLVRIALRDARAMDGERLGKLFGMTRAGINFRVQRIRGILAGEKLSNENDNRQKGEASGLRLPKMEFKLRGKGRKAKGLCKGKVSADKREEVVDGEEMERRKQGKAFKPKKILER